MIKPKKCKLCKSMPEIMWHKFVYANRHYSNLYRNEGVLKMGYFEIVCKCSKLLQPTTTTGIEECIKLWNKGMRNG